MISLLILTPQAAIFGFINGIESDVYINANHIIWMFKLYVYKSREYGALKLSRLMNEIKTVKLSERKSGPKWYKETRTI